MTSRERQLDEFESLFRSVVRPHVTLEPLAIAHLLAVVDPEGSESKREAVLDCAAELSSRLSAAVRLVAPVRPLKREAAPSTVLAHRCLESASQRLADAPGLTAEILLGGPATSLLEEIRAGEPSVVLLPSLLGEDEEELERYTRGSACDRILAEVAAPVLLLVGPVDKDRLFSQILVCVESPVKAEVSLRAVAGLARPGAALTLLHVLDGRWLATLRHGLELAREVSTEGALEAVLRALQRDLGHFLEAAAQTLRGQGFQVTTSLEVGDPVQVTRARIQADRPGLVVCSGAASDHHVIGSLAYSLTARLREAPVLLT